MNSKKKAKQKEYTYPPIKTHTLFVKEVCMAKKGQITIPKAIRDEDGLKENDMFVVTHTYEGGILFEKKVVRQKEDDFFAFLKTLPKFDVKKAWQEIREERDRDR